MFRILVGSRQIAADRLGQYAFTAARQNATEGQTALETVETALNVDRGHGNAIAEAAASMVGVTIHYRGSGSERRRLPGGPRGRGLPVRPRRRKPTGRSWTPELTVVPAGNGQQGPTVTGNPLRPSRVGFWQVVYGPKPGVTDT